MKINEVFYSIQGEGVYQGLPTVFVRLQGCNLMPNFCKWCDTQYARDSDGGFEMPVDEVVGEVSRLSPHYNSWVCITGGEPLWQVEELEYLVRTLTRGGYKIEVETNGSLPKPRWWTLVDSWCADIKCPSSGVCGISLEQWFKTRPQDQVKFVVGSEEDLGFTERMLKRHMADNPTILVSPVINYCPVPEWLQRVAEFCKEHRVRFSLQWHKVVWGNKKGV